MSSSFQNNEAARLHALWQLGILDTDTEEAFDRYSGLASRLFNVPMAAVTLVDEKRQWFKSQIGLGVRETPRDVSFCAHVVVAGKTMVINNTLHDARFRDSPPVTGSPHLRFYAGAPLTVAGQHIGTLSIMDTAPRAFTADEQHNLEELAKCVVAEMELRRSAKVLAQREDALTRVLQENNQLAVAVTHLTSGVVITNPSLPDNPIVFANPAFYEVTSYTPEDIIGKNCRFLQGPDTDASVVAQLREAIATRKPFSQTLLNYRKDGTPFVNELNVSPVFNDEGELISFVGLQNDVTARVQAEQAVREAQEMIRRANQELEQRVEERTHALAQSQVEVLNRLARAGEFRDDDTGQHTQRVARTAGLLARACGLSEYQAQLIEQAAPLHDVGKIGISDLILLKPGKLTDEEFGIMKSHAAVGAALLSGGTSEVVQVAERIAGGHHERWDGNGYPRGLAVDSIPIEARIVAVADVFDALTHSRPYKAAWSVPDALAEIMKMEGRSFDPAIVEAFAALPHEQLI